ncbi:iron-sulfur cluster assembly accessory protein [Brevundimonas sp.]|uniref:HesB/IscA family protein n=1 Tax=Brevundimonas sp. TaxID=1871086 RepID=UPI00263000B8|nr:iron-sulfur cluster assembly accessory protein [Brevundimonas sp.]
MTDLRPTPRPRRPRPAVVTLTPAAADRVRDLLAAQPDKAGLKIGLKNGGCAGQEYTFAMAEAAEPMDEVVSADGATVIVDGKAVLYLLGSEIDYETTRVASRFVFRNPNQTDACGCGESVTITPAERPPA